MRVLPLIAVIGVVLVVVAVTVSLAPSTADHPASSDHPTSIPATVSATTVASTAAIGPASPAPTTAMTPDSMAASPGSRASNLKILIELLLRGTQTQEAGKDATCWTTVRLMDAHFAGRPISDDVAALKIEACKTLVYQLWRRASLAVAPGQQSLQAENIDAALPQELREATDLLNAAKPVSPDDPVRSVMNRDYQRVTENKRYIISLSMEAVLGAGLFTGRQVDILPLSLPAADHLASCATLVTTQFLSNCGIIAEQAGHGQVQAEDVQAAFATAVARLDIHGASAPADVPRPAYVDSDLLRYTRQMISNKISSLKAWNHRIWNGVTDPVENQRQYMNRFIATPFDADGFNELRLRLRKYADYVALGVEPMKRNMFSSYINAHPRDLDDPASSAVPRRDFADLPWTLNLLEDVFPRQMLTSGDVTVTLVPVPSMPGSMIEHGPEDLAQQEIRLLDFELDAVRDTTIHWSLMQDAWASPEARPADPFALEALADRMSELALLFARACDRAAKDVGAKVIDRRICDQVLHGYQFADPPRTVASWAADLPKLPALKAAAFKGIFLAPFIDASKGSGLPETPQVRRVDGLSLQDGSIISLVNFMGSGIAVGDIDGDGLPDLFLAGDGGNRLLRNLGNGHFQDITTAYGITDTKLDDVHQALFVDYDNDGHLDLFIVHSASPSRLFHQKPDGHFEDVTATCGIVTGEFAHDAVWFDYDNDGLLDCYVGHYGGSHPTLDGRNGGKNRLFHNLGNGHFEDVTDRSGMGSTCWTLALAACDFTHDGRQDVFVANDYGRNELYHNNGDGTFTEIGRQAGIDDRGSSMNASLIDVAGDGWFGVYVTQIDMFSKSIGFVFPTDADHINVNQRIIGSTFYLSGDKLYRNRHDGTFESVEERAFEPGDRGWAWSANFFDYANAGHQDCYVTNGWMNGTPAALQQHQFFIQDHGRYYLWDRGGAQSYRSNARSSVAADLLGDGRIDLVVNDYGAPPHLLLNTSRNANHWIKIRLRGVQANRQGIGALVHVTAGALSQWKAVSCGSNYLSQDDTTLTFGIGAADHIDGIDVLWPGNHPQHLPGPLPSDRLTVVTQGRGTTAGP